MIFCIIEENGEMDARELPHMWGDQPAYSYIWNPALSPNPFWEHWKKQKSHTEIDPDDGVVVINFKTKWLGSVQSYSSVFLHTPTPTEYQYEFNVEDPTTPAMQEIKRLWDGHRFSKYIERSREDLGYINLNPTFKSYSSEELNDFTLFCKALQRQQLYPRAVIPLPLDPPVGWTFEEWGDDETGYTRLIHEIATHSTAPSQSVRSWNNVRPQAQQMFETVQSQRQKDTLMLHVEIPSTDYKKKM